MMKPLLMMDIHFIIYKHNFLLVIIVINNREFIINIELLINSILFKNNNISEDVYLSVQDKLIRKLNK